MTPGFKAAIEGSFHIIILPKKILASTAPVNFNPLDIPGKLYAGTTALAEIGTVTSVDALSSAYCAEVRGASDSPKSTDFAVIAFIPAPLPTLW